MLANIIEAEREQERDYHLLMSRGKKFFGLSNGYQKLESKPNVKTKKKEHSDWLKSEEVIKILGISMRTWQNWRDKRLIPFSQFGRKIYVRKDDLEEFMLSHIIKPRR